MSKTKLEEYEVSERRTHVSPIWLTVYSDVMTNLMIFFLMLFALTRMHASQRDRIYKAISKEFSGIRVEKTEQKKPEQSKEKENQNVGYVEENEEQIKFTFASPILFDSNSAELKKSAFGVLDIIREKIESTDYSVIVEGHTDSDPIKAGKYPSNWQLSAARAFSVLKYFMQSSKIVPNRLSAFGYGEFKPVAPNDTEENKAKNRRIEVIMVKK
jgi:chemotaxis protein MotB